MNDYDARTLTRRLVAKRIDEALSQAAVPAPRLEKLGRRLDVAIDPDKGVDINAIDDVIRELYKLAAVPAPPDVQGLSLEDIKQIIEGIDHFIIMGVPELETIWRPYIDKLEALTASSGSRQE